MSYLVLEEAEPHLLECLPVFLQLGQAEHTPSPPTLALGRRPSPALPSTPPHDHMQALEPERQGSEEQAHPLQVQEVQNARV
jgi:hypothetical protein